MGAFIVLEGIDGSGKSTACARVADELRSRGLDVILTAEPTHDGIGAFIRSGNAGKVSQRAESLLFTADRYEHTSKIRRQVSEGRVVVCDRYYPSTVAYQSAKLDGDSADLGWLKGLCEPFTDEPDAVILLDMDPEESMGRVEGRGLEESKFENIAFLRQVRSAYLDLAREFGYSVVDASRSADEVFRDVMTIIQEVV